MTRYAPNEKINILIVDDRSENIVALEALLERDGVNLIGTMDPNEALKICWDMDIAIALVDVQMPQMDGFELVELLKSNPKTKDIIVLFVTAVSKESNNAVRGLSAGAIDYLYKPLDPFVTSTKIDSFIKLARNQRALKNKKVELERIDKELFDAKEEAELGKKIRENLLAGMSYELCTPLSEIIGILKLLKHTTLTEEQKELIKLIEISSFSLMRVIDDILDLSKMEAGKLSLRRSKTDLVKNCNYILNLLTIQAEEKDLKLAAEFDRNLPAYIMADSFRLDQILINLISNAIKFTSSGKVTLKVAVLEHNGNEQRICFCVSDTGIGVRKLKTNPMFDFFGQANAGTTIQFGGPGLGLNMVEYLIKLKGGTFEVTSEEGMGTNFIFKNWYKTISDKDGKFLHKEDPKILIAEDNVICALLIRKMLMAWKIKFDFVENGKDAMDYLSKNKYALILLDTHMPVMNGVDVIKSIRAGAVPGKENVPLIMFSSTINDEKDALMKVGANDVIAKPFDFKVLRNIISFYLLQDDPGLA